MPKQSAGLLMYRIRESVLEVLLAHPGGPFWAGKDEGAWTIPKGGIAEGEEPLAAARREFQEELGIAASGDFVSIGRIRQKGGKLVEAWAFKGDFDPAQIVSNTFELEWPPRSGKTQHFPEVDRAEFFTLEIARQKIIPAQIPFLDILARTLS